MKTDLKNFLPGVGVTLLCIITSCIFIYIMASTQMLTAALMWLCVAVLVLFAAVVFLLTASIRHRVRFIIGCVLAAIFITVQILGAYYIGTGAAALDDITTPEVEYAEIGVYVHEDDKAITLADAKDYTFGILEVLDRDATNIAVEKINNELGVTIKTIEFSGISELFEGLFVTKQINAFILNKSFLELLEETKELEDYAKDIRELYSVKIDHNASSGTQAPPPEDDTFTVYMSGIDCFGSVSRRSRSDVNILATVNTKTGQILLVSTPRDYFVPLSISNGVPDKLTHAGIYGINVSKDTLAMLYDIDIDYYFRVNFDGFKDIIDALGGITANSFYPFKAADTYYITKGENQMSGEVALHFARERHNVPGGDGTRGKHQMEVIKGVINKMLSPALLKNYTGVLNSVSGSFETSIPYETIASLVKDQLSNNTKWNVTSYSVSGTGASRRTYSQGYYAYVLIPDQSTVAHAKMLMEQVEDGEVPTP